MTKKDSRSTAIVWAHFRFSVIGSLLSAPPARGELKATICALAEKDWTHPVTGQEVRFSAVTIERWYYKAHFREVFVRYALWDLGRVDLVDPQSGTILAPIYPLDRAANADGRRSAIGPDRGPDDGTLAHGTPDDGGPDKPLPPLLKRILDEYSASGAPPAYLPKQPDPKKNKNG